MIVSKKEYTPLTFKKIQLSQAETKAASMLFQDLSKKPELINTESFKLKIFNIFNKHLKKEVTHYSEKYIWKEDFLQSLYLKFFELLLKLNIPQINTASFVEELNNIIKPDKYDKKQYIKSLHDTIGSSNKFKIDLLVEENLPIYKSQKNEKENQVNTDKVHSIISDTNLTNNELYAIEQVSQDKSYKKISRERNVSNTTIRRYHKTGLAKLQASQNSLPEDFKKKVKEFAEVLNIDENKCLKTCLKYIFLLSKSSQDLSDNINACAETLKIKKEDFIKAGLRYPQIFIKNPDFLKNKLSAYSEFLGKSEEELAKIFLKQPQLLTQDTENLKKRISDASKILGISKEDYIKMILAYPSLFSFKVETMNNNISKSANLLGITKECFFNACIKHPTLFAQKPSTIIQNIEKLSKLLGLSKEDCVNLALLKSQLFYQKPETVYNNALEASKLIGISLDEYLKIVKNRPTLLTYNPETIKEKTEIMYFFQKIRKEKQAIVILSKSVNDHYKDILAHYIKKNLAKDKIKLNQQNFLEILKAHPEKELEFILPEDKLNNEFIEYTKKCFIDNNIKNKCSFIINKDY